jgi:hypothetical protein
MVNPSLATSHHDHREYGNRTILKFNIWTLYVRVPRRFPPYQILPSRFAALLLDDTELRPFACWSPK